MHIGTGPAETLMSVADLAAELDEPLRVGDAQGLAAVGVAYVSGD